jgi:large subunit ribosomal protein L19
MTMHALQQLEQQQMKQELPDFRPGDTVRIQVRIVEGARERLQAFEGIVIAISGSGVRRNITVRKVSYGVGVERIFPLHSPRIESIQVIRYGRYVGPSCFTCGNYGVERRVLNNGASDKRRQHVPATVCTLF